MKIVIPVLNFSRAGGARVLSQLASVWGQMGHEVVFIAHQGSAIPYYPTQAKIIWTDDNGYCIPINAEEKRHSGWCSILNSLGLLLGLNRYASECDIMLANHNLTAWPVVLCRSRARKFYYVQAYEPEYCQSRSDFRGRVLEKVAEWGYRLPLRRIVNAPVYFDYQQLRADRYVPPGVDLQTFFPGLEAVCHKPFRLGCIGRNEAEKGTHDVLAAFELLLQRSWDVELRVASFGVLPEKYLCHPRVVIQIPGNDAELADYYRSLDVLAAPGIGQRGAPHYPVIESMACGVPVVTTGYYPASTDNAWIVPESNPAALAATLIEVMNRPDFTREKVSRALRDVQELAWDRVAQRMLDVFMEGEK